MRIATCLSGHSRNYRYNFPNIPFETDYFISSCMESGLPNNTTEYVSYHSQNNINTNLADIDNILSLYDPRIYEFLSDRYIPDEMLKFDGFKTLNNGFLTHIGMMFYRMYKANILKKEYEFDNNFKYDFVIRSRFDVKVNSVMFNKNYFYIVNTNNNFCDLFFAGDSHIMDIISECYLWFVKQDIKYLSGFKNGEDILTHYIEHLKLNINYLSTFDVTFNKDYPIEIKNIKNGIIIPIYG
jgi:hypothetical protein